MPSRKISELDTINNLTGQELLVATRPGLRNFKIQIQDIKSLFTKADVNLANVDNTADADKPISTTVATALDAKANTAHQHAIDQVIDLSNALSQKAQVLHAHVISDVQNLDVALISKAAVSHTHVISDVDELTNSLAAKADTVAVDALLSNKSNLGHTHNASEISGIPQIPTGLATQTFVTDAIAAEPVHQHIHEVSEVINLAAFLNSKAPITHAHEIADVTNLVSALSAKVSNAQLIPLLNDKANTNHQHEITDINNLSNTLSTLALSTTVDSQINSVRSDLNTTINDVASNASAALNSVRDSLEIQVTNLNTTVDGKANLGHVHTTTEVADFTQAVQSVVSDMIIPGNNITMDKSLGNIVVSSTGGSPAPVAASIISAKIFDIVSESYISQGSNSYNHTLRSQLSLGPDVIMYNSYAGDEFIFAEPGTYRIHIETRARVADSIKVNGTFTPALVPSTLIPFKQGYTVNPNYGVNIVGINVHSEQKSLDLSQNVDTLGAWASEFYLTVLEQSASIRVQTFMSTDTLYTEANNFNPNEWLATLESTYLIEALTNTATNAVKTAGSHCIFQFVNYFNNASIGSYAASLAVASMVSSVNGEYAYDDYARAITIASSGVYRINVKCNISNSQSGVFNPLAAPQYLPVKMGTRILTQNRTTVIGNNETTETTVYVPAEDVQIESWNHEFYIVVTGDANTGLANFIIQTFFESQGIADLNWQVDYNVTVGIERLYDAPVV